MNRADADNAVLEAGDDLTEEQAAVVALGQLNGRAGDGAPGVVVAQRVNIVSKQGADEGVVELGELALEGGEQGVDFGPDSFFRGGRRR